MRLEAVRISFNLTVVKLLLAAVAVCFFACEKETLQVEEVKIKPPLKGYKITARLDNKQTGTDSEAKGLLAGKYSENTKVLDYKLEFSGLTPKAIKVKKGPRGTLGEIVFQLTADSVNGVPIGCHGQKKLTPLQERDLIKGTWFIVIETEKHPLQEIRGQITLKSE